MSQHLLLAIVSLLLVFAAHPAAAAEVASVEVSLVVKESCLVRQLPLASADPAPAVSCDLDSPYRVQPGTDASPLPPRVAAAPQSIALTPSLWQVTF